MTNNPTIDGVSRKTCEGCNLSGSYHPDVKHCTHCAKPLGHADAPAVERQEPAACTKCSGVGFLPGTQNCHRCHGSGSEPVDFAALQSTIAQLQARIGELESGRGQPSYWIVESPANLEPVLGAAYTAECAEKFRKTGWKVTPVFTAQQAPVAVTLSDDQILEAMREHIYAADGGYVFDTAKPDVIAAGRALINAALNGGRK